MFTPVSVYKSQLFYQEFPLVTVLSSKTSAIDWNNSTLFGFFFGTMTMSDFSKSLHVRSTATDLPQPLGLLQYQSETLEISRFSSIEFPSMHRVSDSARFDSDSLFYVAPDIAFPFVVQGRHQE